VTFSFPFNPACISFQYFSSYSRSNIFSIISFILPYTSFYLKSISYQDVSIRHRAERLPQHLLTQREGGRGHWGLKRPRTPRSFWVCSIPSLVISANQCRFLQAGAAKVYITSRKAAACEAAVAALNKLPNLQPGAKAISVPADSAKIAGVKHLVSEVAKTTDHVDILFANAGATWGAAFDDHPDEVFAKVMDLNVKSVFNTIRE